MLDLNNEQVLNSGNSQVFNGGNAGKVTGKLDSVEKFDQKPTPGYPDYRINFVDMAGAPINKGIYYPTLVGDSEKDQAALMRVVKPLVAIIKVFKPEDYMFPSTEGKSSKEIVDMLMNIVKECSQTQPMANLFATYNTKSNPKRFLNLRGFNFIERTDIDEAVSILKPTNNDLMVRPEADQPQQPSEPTGGSMSGGW